MATDDRLRELEEKYEGYKVYDNRGEKIGKVDDLFVDESDREEYIGVKLGLFGMRSTLIPMDIARVNERDRAIEVADTKDHVKDAPNFDDDDDITPDFERRIRSHFGLEDEGSSATGGSYGRYSGTGTAGAAIGESTARGEGLQSDRDRSLGEPTGGTQDSDADEDYRELDVESSPEVSDAGEDYRELDVEASPEDSPEASRETRGREEGAQTGDDQSPTREEIYREAYREGFREGHRAAAGGGETSTGGEGREGSSRRSDEGEESGVTRVWRRMRS